LKNFILKRLLIIIPLLFGITLLTFALTKALPGDPVYSLVGERTSPEIIEKIRREIGADKTIFSQYLGYVSLLLHGEMGRSYYTNRKVLDDIVIKFPNTLKLAAGAMLIATPLGIFFGLAAALKRGTCFDRIASGLSITALSLPVFWSGLILMLFFSLKLKILPPSGTGGVEYLLLPSLTLSLPAAATLMRVTRVTVLDIVKMPFVRTARAKGVSAFRLNGIHVMKNALIPIVTVIGLDFGSYLNGAVLTETIFGWNGIGRYAMEGILKRDYPVIMGCILTGTVTFVIMNLIVDVLYFYMDPRVTPHGTDR
jgi:ABC-type dipeptide/oligopeptide/nickel transport system permease component